MTGKFLFKGLLLFTVFLMVACEGILIHDPIDPRLPMYTENGNNVSGAFINGKTWRSVKSCGFMTCSNEALLYGFMNDSLVISFEGELEDLEDKVFIEFSLAGYGINSYQDLTKLHGIKISLNAETNSGMVIGYGTCNEDHASQGQLYFRKAKLNSANQTIFSGTFGFKIENSGCETIEVSYGRFDYIISESDFIQSPL